MLKSKVLIAAALTSFCYAGASAQTANVEPNDILSILERNSKNELIKPPTIIPYIYTIEMNVFGEKDGGESSADVRPETNASDEGVETDEVSEPTASEGKESEIDLDNYSAVIEINPSLIGDERVTIISHTGDPEDDSFKTILAEITGETVSAEDLASDFWCDGDDFIDKDEGFVKEAFTVISETESEAVVKPDLTKMAKLLLESSSDGEISKGEKKLMRRMLKRLDGEIRFSKPDGRMTGMKAWMTRSMRVMLVAKIRDVKFSSSCELAPNGFSYSAVQNMEMKMSAFGIKVDQNVHRRVTNLKPLP